ncbi:MAG: hypothetical protein AAGA70_10110 [Pseudomonadota bacterium]
MIEPAKLRFGCCIQLPSNNVAGGQIKFSSMLNGVSAGKQGLPWAFSGGVPPFQNSSKVKSNSSQKGLDFMKLFLAASTVFFLSVQFGISQTTDLPEQVRLPGAMDGLGIATRGYSLEMTLEEILAASGGTVSESSWRASGDIEFNDVWAVEFGERGVDFTSVAVSRWHSFNRPLRIERTVNYGEDDRILLNVFIAALSETYGPNFRNWDGGSGDAIRANIGNFSFGFRWAYVDGNLSPTCEPIDLPRTSRRAIPAFWNNNPLISRIDADRLLPDVQAGAACGGEVIVAYSLDQFERVQSFTVIIQDVLAILSDIQQDERVRAEIEQAFNQSVLEGNTNEPEL